MPTRKQVLRKLELGNSVAEFDEALESYFVETETFRLVVRGKGDIVAGDKGTGKTALFKILKKRYTTLAETRDVEVLTGFNPDGAPVFERLATGEVLSEGQYITIWKAYLVSLVGNWVLGIYEGALTDRMARLDRLLRSAGLRASDDQPTTVFNLVANLYRKIADPDALEVTATLSPDGIPLVAATVSLGSGEERRKEVPHREVLQLLNDVLDESEIHVWVVLDRLDEAFQAHRDIEIPALRALLRTFLDIQEFSRLHLKLLVRNDLFRRVISGGFVNLTHVNARKIEIVWDDADLLDLLARRVAENPGFLEEVRLADDAPSDKQIYAIFPQQVDTGDRKPTTPAWILSRIRDGNNVKAPRNLIDLVKKAQDAQLRRDELQDP